MKLPVTRFREAWAWDETNGIINIKL